MKCKRQGFISLHSAHHQVNLLLSIWQLDIFITVTLTTVVFLVLMLFVP